MTWGPADNPGFIREEQGEAMFREGAQAMREMLARFVEQGGDKTTAASIRANWNSSWGADPGRPDKIISDIWSGQ